MGNCLIPFAILLSSNILYGKGGYVHMYASYDVFVGSVAGF